MKFLLKTFLITFTLIQAVQAGRYYNTEDGRFISRDPLGYVDGMSLYNGYFAETFGLDPSGYNSKIKRHPLRVINSWAEVQPGQGHDRVNELRANSWRVLGQAGTTIHHAMSLMMNYEDCPKGCKKLVLVDDKWDDVEIWGYVQARFRNRRGDPNVRPNRTRTTFDHETAHMDIEEKEYKRREAVVKILLTNRCEPLEKANARHDLIVAAWEMIAAIANVENTSLDITDYSENYQPLLDAATEASTANDTLDRAINRQNRSDPNNRIDGVNFR